MGGPRGAPPHRGDAGRSLCGSPPHSRSDVAPGLRPPARARAQGPAAGPHPGHHGPLHPHHPPRRGGRDPPPGPPGGGPDPAARGQLPGVRDPPLRPGERAAGDRPRHRSRAGPHPARHDHRLRGQPHQHPRGLWRPGLWDRDQRGGPRARHPVPAPGPAPHPGRGSGGGAGPGGHGQGPHPGPHRPPGGGGRDRARDRVPGLGHPLPLHGRADDGLQHVRGSGGPGGPRRPGGGPTRPRDAIGNAPSTSGAPSPAPRGPPSTARSVSTPRTWSP